MHLGNKIFNFLVNAFVIDMSKLYFIFLLCSYCWMNFWLTAQLFQGQHQGLTTPHPLIYGFKPVQKDSYPPPPPPPPHIKHRPPRPVITHHANRQPPKRPPKQVWPINSFLSVYPRLTKKESPDTAPFKGPRLDSCIHCIGTKEIQGHCQVCRAMGVCRKRPFQVPKFRGGWSLPPLRHPRLKKVVTLLLAAFCVAAAVDQQLFSAKQQRRAEDNLLV